SCAIAKGQAGRAEPLGPVHVRVRTEPYSTFDSNFRKNVPPFSPAFPLISTRGGAYMKMPLVKAAVVAVFCFLLAGGAKADSTCSATTSPFVCFAFANVGSDGPGVFDVMMEATITGTSTTFSSFAVNFSGATSVNLESSPSGGGWVFIGNH